MTTYTIALGSDPNTVLTAVNPGDIVVVAAGIHNGYLWGLTRSGNSGAPIEIYGQPGARIQTPNGRTGAQYGFSFSGADYWYLHDLIIEEAGKAVVADDCQHFKIQRVEARFTRDEAIKIRNNSQYFYVDACTVHDTLVGGATGAGGEGIYCGQASGNWVPEENPQPDVTAYGLLTGNTIYRVGNDGIDIKEGSHHIVAKGNTVDHSQGNAPSSGAPLGDSGVYARGDNLQFIDNTFTGIVGSAHKCYITTVNGITYGNGSVEVKGGSSTGQGDAGVESQSAGMKVYSDFTSSSPRTQVVSGGWSGSASLNPAAFSQLGWASPAAYYGAAAPAAPPGLSLVGFSTATTGGTSATHTVPNSITGLQNGDFLVAFQSEAAGANALSELSGATGFTTSGAGAGNLAVGWLKVFTKTAASEPANWTFGKSDSTGVVTVVALRGQNPSAPVNVAASYSVSGPASPTPTKVTGHIAPAVSPTVANCWLLCCFAGNSGEGDMTVSHSTPSGMTEIADTFFLGSSAFNNHSVDYELRASTGTTGTRTATSSVATHYVTASLAIAPSPGAVLNADMMAGAAEI